MLGFILPRHVNSKETNNLWIHAVQKISFVYPKAMIVVIDDNSNYDFVTQNFPLHNVLYLQSEYPGHGELLPYIYLLKFKWFTKAVILHDSVFVHETVPKFESSDNLPLWHFTFPIHHDKVQEHELLLMLTNHEDVLKRHDETNFIGVFGGMSTVTLEFIEQLENKYNFTVWLGKVTNRHARMSLERVLGVLFSQEIDLREDPSVFGNIHQYCRWGTNFNQYLTDKTQRPVTKVWSGR